MNFKKLIIVLFLTTIAMFSLLIGFSYAWYATAGTDVNVTTANYEDIKVTFDTSAYINTMTGIPIVDADVATKANKTTFSIQADTHMALKADYTISLSEIRIANELKKSTFRWQLLSDGTSVANGNFLNIGTSTTLDLYTKRLTLNSNTPDNYELRIWLSENNLDQNSLMNKVFTGKIVVKTVLIK